MFAYRCLFALFSPVLIKGNEGAVQSPEQQLHVAPVEPVPVSGMARGEAGKDTPDAFEPLLSPTTVIELRIMPIQQLYAIVPAFEGVNSITLSPGTSSFLIPYAGTITVPLHPVSMLGRVRI